MLINSIKVCKSIKNKWLAKCETRYVTQTQIGYIYGKCETNSNAYATLWAVI
jgi:hypothetical protein